MRRFVLLLLSIILVVPSYTHSTVGAQGGIVRRVYAPYFDGEIRWAEAGIFWFGRVAPPGTPGQNYADVRVAYDAEELVVYVNVEDYYIWYDTGAISTSDLTRYDAVAIYLDTTHDRAAAPPGVP